ncbi:ParB/RepB/Spo0J family partition protein, partial [Mycobacterium sp. MS1601]|uniref:ParB/RepB/Spo0J family partition protein n=1 Tax=Mycobacterium sp. MS1601 TaxID=1936029 RepID=UPI001F310553
MSENTTTVTDNDTNAQVAAAGTLEHLDPHTLELETNVRDDAALDADFVASIKEHGVLNPIAAVRGHDGVVRVRAGQRRTLAAREAGLTSVPVYVRPAGATDDKAQVVERVSEQIVENDRRRELTEAQRARGIQQMLDAGASVTKVAKKLSIGRDTVKSVATAAGSQAAMEALDAGNCRCQRRQCSASSMTTPTPSCVCLKWPEPTDSST